MSFRFASNFLQTVRVLRAVSPAVAGEFRLEGDALGTEPGELLVAPFGDPAASGCGGRHFLGALTLSCASVARVEEMPAVEAFAAHADSPWAQAAGLSDDQVVAVVLQQSSRLMEAGPATFLRVRAATGGPVFHGAHVASPRAGAQPIR
jgi:hypothetical protein